MRLGLSTAAACLVAASTACLSPTPSFGAYEEKAVATAESAVAAIGTARLTIRAATQSRAFKPYMTVLFAESEDQVESAQATFDSIQPPDTRSDDLRRQLDAILQPAAGQLTEIRIAARRGAFDALVSRGTALRRSIAKLMDFVDAHR